MKDPPPRLPGFRGVFARWLRRLRWFVVLGWLAGAAWITVSLPSLESAANGEVGALLPDNAAAIRAELQSNTQFGFPLLSRTLLVQRDPQGLPAREQVAAARRAAALTRGDIPALREVRGAIPIPNTFGVPPFSREHGTTIVSYLFLDPRLNAAGRTEVGQRLEAEVGRRPGEFVGLTGAIPARVEQGDIVLSRLPWVELGTILLVALAVGLRLRAVGAPLVTLLAIGVAYLISSHVVAWVGQKAGFSVPQEVEPVMVVLVFGVVTDYAIFFIGRFRALLAEGRPRLDAAERSTAQISPIVLTAGITVMAATSSLLVAQLQFFRVFGPGLAFAVLCSLVVAITFIPAALAVGGGALFWPRRPQPEEPTPDEPGAERTTRRRRSRAARLASGHPILTALACLLVLGAASAGLKDLRLSNPIIQGLPGGAEARQGYEQAAKGFAPGVLSPTVLIVSRPGVTAQRRALAAFQRRLARQPGLALVLGPGQQPLRRVRLGATLSKGGNAARYFLVYDSDPLGARAIAQLRSLEDRLPALLRRAGLPRARAAVAGDTALSAETIDKTISDLKRVTPVALAAIFILLAIFLRAIVAPLYLLTTSVVAFAAALGIGTWVFQDALGFEGITYYVPFAVAVLLVSLGSDYNVFVMGRIWQEARQRPLREAVPLAATRAARSITLAGIVLAGSFALVALVPLRPFYEVALMMAAGLLLDAFLVRTLLVPALVVLVGERSAWPSRLRPREAPA